MKQQLLDGHATLCVWGLGYIGFSTMSFYANRGVSMVGIDCDPAKVRQLNEGKATVEELVWWLQASQCQPVIQEKMHAFNSLEEIPADQRSRIALHFVAVPTEREGEPWFEPIWDALGKIHAQNGIAVIESTLSPRLIASIKERFPALKYAVAPRRDWFGSPELNLASLPRVVGSDDQATLNQVVDVLGIVTNTLHKASGALEACMVKSVENTIRQTGVAFANELASMWGSQVNVREVLRLAATKWNVEHYQPSMGIGGYCLPLAPKYVVDMAPTPGPFVEAAIGAMANYEDRLIEWIGSRGFKSVFFAGIEYRADLGVYKCSPFVLLAQRLLRGPVQVAAAGECCSPEYVTDLLPGAKAAQFPQQINDYELVVIGSGHKRFRVMSWSDIQPYVGSTTKLVIDNEGVFARFRDKFAAAGIQYLQPGERGWLS